MANETPVPDAPLPAKPSLRNIGRVNIFFRMAAGLVALFVVTIFALIAVLFGDPAAPIARLLDRIGMQLILAEMCAILIVGTFAMTVDRHSAPPTSDSAAEDSASNGGTLEESNADRGG